MARVTFIFSQRTDLVMGVRGLQAWLRGYLTDMPQLDLSALATNDCNTILIDALSIILGLPNYDLQMQLSPEFMEIHSCICSFVALFEKAQINLVWYFDKPSSADQSKFDEMIRRQNDSVQRTDALLSWLDGSFVADSIFLGDSPMLVTRQASETLRLLNQTIVFCDGEADEQLARDGANKNVIAVISGDSDFYMMDGVQFMPVDKLFLKGRPIMPARARFSQNCGLFDSWTIADFCSHDLILKQGGLSCILVDANWTASCLKIDTERLVEFSFLVGNDYSRGHLDVIDKLFNVPLKSQSGQRRLSYMLEILQLQADSFNLAAFFQQESTPEFSALTLALLKTYQVYNMPVPESIVCIRKAPTTLPVVAEQLWSHVLSGRISGVALKMAFWQEHLVSVQVESAGNHAVEILTPLLLAQAALLGCVRLKIWGQRGGGSYAAISHMLPDPADQAAYRSEFPVSYFSPSLQNRLTYSQNAFGQTREAEDVPFFPPCLLLIDQNAADVDSSSSMRLFLHPLFSLPVLHSAVTFEMCCPYALPTSLRLPMLSVLFLVGARVSVGKRLNLSDTVALCAMLATVHVLSPNVTHSAFEFNDDEKRDQTPFSGWGQRSMLRLALNKLTLTLASGSNEATFCNIHLEADNQPWVTGADGLLNSTAVTTLNHALFVFSELSSLRLLCNVSDDLVPICAPASIIHGDVFYVWRRVVLLALQFKDSVDPFELVNRVAPVIKSIWTVIAPTLVGSVSQVTNLLETMFRIIHNVFGKGDFAEAIFSHVPRRCVGNPNIPVTRAAAAKPSPSLAALLASFPRSSSSSVSPSAHATTDRLASEPIDSRSCLRGHVASSSSTQKSASAAPYSVKSVLPSSALSIPVAAPQPCASQKWFPSIGDRMASLAPLPITAFTEDILQRVRNDAVTIIQGDTGSGKSTRVPQMIMHEWKHRQENVKSSCLIYVTQPRRIAAISLAKRVASELGQEVGDEDVGFRIGNTSECGPKARIVFVTAGWLLQRLIATPSFIQKCSHLVLDEVHERSIDSDLLCVVIRRLLRHISGMVDNRKPRLVLMSATFNAALFSKYFASDPRSAPADAIFVGTRRVTFSSQHLNEILKYRGLNSSKLFPSPCNDINLKRLGQVLAKSTHADGNSQKTLFALLCWICLTLAALHADSPEGNCILVFCAGMQDIEEAHERLSTCYDELRQKKTDLNLKFDIAILHSLVEDPMSVFADIAPGCSRIVLSTNIAESSVTIPNVRYVIDFGSHKQIEYSTAYRCPLLAQKWISKASCMQRAGRAGRLLPGYVFRMFSREHFDSLSDYDVPEIQRVSLASTILRLKMSAASEKQAPLDCTSNGDVHCVNVNANATSVNESKEEADETTETWPNQDKADECLEDEALGADALADGGMCDSGAHASASEASFGFASVLRDPEQVLRETLQPPAVKDIHLAFQELIQSGALTVSHVLSSSTSMAGFADAQLTFLGRFLAQLPFSFELGRLVALAVALRPALLPHVVIVAAACSQSEVYMLPHALMTPEPSTFVSMVARSTYGRLKFDEGHLSDMLSPISLFRQYAAEQEYAASTSVRAACNRMAAHSPKLLQVLDVHQSNHELLGTFCYVYGISYPRMKTFLGSVAEISLRLTGLLPLHRGALSQLSYLARGGLRSRAKAKSGKEPDSVCTDWLLPFDTLSVRFLHVLLAASFQQHVLSVRLDCKVHTDQPVDQMITISGTSQVDSIADLPDFALFRPCIDAANAAKDLTHFRFAPFDICPPIVLHSSFYKRALVLGDAKQLFARYFFSRSFGGSSQRRETAMSSMTEEINGAFRSSSLAGWLLTRGARTVAAPPFASLVFHRVFTARKVTLTIRQDRPVGMIAPSLPIKTKQPSIVQKSVAKFSPLVNEHASALKFFLGNHSIADTLLKCLHFDFDQSSEVESKETEANKKQTLKVQQQLYALITNVVATEKAYRADKVSVLPFASALQRSASWVTLLLTQPGTISLCGVDRIGFCSPSGVSAAADVSVPSSLFENLREVRDLLANILDRDFYVANLSLAAAIENLLDLEPCEVGLTMPVASNSHYNAVVLQPLTDNFAKSSTQSSQKKKHVRGRKAKSQASASATPACLAMKQGQNAPPASATTVANESQQFPCPICQKGFAKASAMTQHLRNKHTESRHSLNQVSLSASASALTCGSQQKLMQASHAASAIATFASSATNQQWQNARPASSAAADSSKKFMPIPSEMQFFCPVCPKGFAKVSTMTQHLRDKHTASAVVPNLLAPSDSTSATASSSKTNTPSAMHFRCPVCQKGFAQASRMAQHLQSKHQK